MDVCGKSAARLCRLASDPVSAAPQDLRHLKLRDPISATFDDNRNRVARQNQAVFQGNKMTKESIIHDP